VRIEVLFADAGPAPRRKRRFEHPDAAACACTDGGGSAGGRLVYMSRDGVVSSAEFDPEREFNAFISVDARTVMTMFWGAGVRVRTGVRRSAPSCPA
jgi:hypothetical protein